ncbi:MAG: hypothetical protein V3T73_03195 [Dehalococcoidales bacterium]
MAELDLVRSYLDSLAELEEAESKIKSLAQMILGAGNALINGPYSLAISGMMDFPPEVIMKRVGFRLNPDDWPTAEEIGEDLLMMHSAHSKVTERWQKLSSSDQQNLTPPPPKRY